jgi:hypothetical protein
MNKTQKRKEITRLFMEYVEETFPDYYISDDEGDGSITIIPSTFEGKKCENFITYHRSYFNILIDNYACKKVKRDSNLMENKLNEILKEIDL